MSIKTFFAGTFAKYISRKVQNESKRAQEFQDFWFRNILSKASLTKFGREHGFDKIKNYSDYKIAVPVTDYEGLKSYIELALSGQKDVLWPGKPLYWAKTSGTTSGIKYIPISKNSIAFHINSARNALLCYIAETGKMEFVDGKMIFLSGSPELEKKNGMLIGRLSGIVNHHIPAYLRKNKMPGHETNCIEDWEQKVDRIAAETINQNMTLISGIPPWVQMYFDKLTEKSGKKIKDIFPGFNLFVHGGVNFEPYRAKMEQCIGKKVDSIETYPASEGFIAFQDSQTDSALLLLTNNGIFYEFIPVDTFYNENPTRISLKDVELNINYVLILNTNAGLYGYNIGDTIKFVSISPYKIIVTGRIKHYISAFGEHVIGEEVEFALISVAQKNQTEILEFTVAPQVNPPGGGLPYHEWFVSFSNPPESLEDFAAQVDEALQKKNSYYFDLIKGSILRPLVMRILSPNAFIDYMKEEGKLGGQNKVPRLSNDRKIAQKLEKHILR